MKKWKRFFQIDDMDLVALAKNIRGHFWMPETGLVSKMDPGLKHLAHTHVRHWLISSGGLASTYPMRRSANFVDGHPGPCAGMCAN